MESALDLGARVRAGELSARELVEAALRTIEARDGQINAFTHVAYERALADADSVRPGGELPFAGVPIAIKDNRGVIGMPLTFCSRLWADGPKLANEHYFVTRLRRAGFVIVGKTALPENGILPTCESRHNGPTANPWDLTRTPGGSSGGSAAAVAAGMLPIAHGNDGGGSTRIPASCCGLVGLKPSRNRISSGPYNGDSFLVGDGVLTRTVADTAAVLDVIAGYEIGDMNTAPPAAPGAFLAAARAEPPRGLRIGMTFTPALDGAELDPECERAVRDTAALLESLGHHVEPVDPPWAGQDLLSDFTRAFGPGIASVSLAGALAQKRELTEDDVEPLTWAMYEYARNHSTLDYLAAMSRLESVGRKIVKSLSPFDFLLTPALASRPVRTGEIHGRGPDPWGNYRRSGAFTPYTAIINVTGLPAISLPLYVGADGLPTAIQVVGRPAGEEALLSLAAQLEAACPWAGRQPPAF